VARRQLLALGITPRAIDRALNGDRLLPLHAGVYAVGHEALPLHAMEMAAVLACGPSAVISHRSAANLWSLPLETAAGQVEVTVRRGWAPRRRGIRVYRTRSLRRRDVRFLDHIPVTSPARTLSDVAALGHEEALELAVAEAISRGLVDFAAIREQLNRDGPRPGTKSMRLLLDRDDGPALTRSVAERKLLRMIRAASLPSPVVNARVGRYEVDFLWREQRLIVEVDGFAWHSSRRAFERDRARDAELQLAGYRVLRITWRQLTREPNAVIQRIARALSADR